MYSSQVKAGVFGLEALNSLSTTYYFYYLYFFMQQKFGFGKLENLTLAALLGVIYMFAAVFGGRFAQKRGYFLSLGLGFFIMGASWAIGSRLDDLLGHLAVAAIATIGMCFTWPTLEALVSENEPPRRLQAMVGLYNFIWAAGGAFAYFTGGAWLEWSQGRSMFLVPGGIIAVQLLLTVWLAHKARIPRGASAPADREVTGAGRGLQKSPVSAKTFLHMAWLANPFAYLAINTVIAVIPTLAGQMHLSPRFAGFFCSVWLFVRAASFILLWLWSGWHYRFRWLVWAFAAMLISFSFILLAPNLQVLIAAQIVFGLAVGLIYYSSLYYSMDVGETKGEHGGLHEAAIGAGSSAGPAFGAAALCLAPGHPDSSTWAVSGLLCCGFVALLFLRFRNNRT